MRSLAIATDYNDENTIQTIADTYNVSKGTVSRIANKFALPKRSDIRRERDASIIERLRAKASLKVIAGEFSVTESRVSQIAKKNGLNRYGNKDEAGIIAAYKHGDKVASIEAAFSIEHSNLYKLLRDNGVKFRRFEK